MTDRNNVASPLRCADRNLHATRAGVFAARKALSAAVSRGGGQRLSAMVDAVRMAETMHRLAVTQWLDAARQWRIP